LTLGSIAGTYTVTATSSGLTGSPVTFTATATNPAPTLASLSTNRAGRGSKINVTLTGTNFVQGVTTVSFGADITMNSVTFVSAGQIIVNIEPHGYFTTNPDRMEEMLAFVDSPWLRMNMDTGNTFIAGPFCCASL
jgi:hypothetical protein